MSLPANAACALASSTTRNPASGPASSATESAVVIRPSPSRGRRSRRRSDPRTSRSTSRVCSPRHGAPCSMCQSVMLRCTGTPSTRTSPISVWCTVGHRPNSMVPGSWSMRSSGVATTDTGTPAARIVSAVSKRSRRASTRRRARRGCPRRRAGRRASRSGGSLAHASSITAASQDQSSSSRHAIAIHSSSPDAG